MCAVRGMGNATLLELIMSLSMLPADHLKHTFGEKMPEIVVDCEMDDEEAQLIEGLKMDLAEKYQ